MNLPKRETKATVLFMGPDGYLSSIPNGALKYIEIPASST